MRKLNHALTMAAITSVVAGGLFVPLSSGLASDTKAPRSAVKTTVVEGTLVDSRCYEKSVALGMPHPNIGVDHMTPNGLKKGCAIKCAKHGVPVAVLERDGTLLVLTAPAKGFAPYMGKHIRVTGMTPFAGSIVPTKVEVQSSSGRWKRLKVD